MKYKRVKIILLLLVILISIIGVGLVWKNNYSLQNPATWREVADNYPLLTPIFLFILIVLEVVFAPIPGGFLPLVTGFLFGPIQGTLYSWGGNVVGASITFFLARNFGRVLVKYFVKETSLDFYDSFLHQRRYLLWFVYALPFFPIDMLSITIGLSKIPFKRFIIMISIALLPGMYLLNLIGARVYDTGIVHLFIGLSFLIVLYIIISFTKEWKSRRK